MNKETILEIVQQQQIGFIHLQFTDILGVMKNVSITSDQLDKALNNEIMFDGSSIDGFVRIEESDMYLHPDLNTFTIFPWSNYPKEARFICDIYHADGTPFTGCPRYILKNALKEAQNMGYIFHVGPECEFFLFNTNEKGEPSLETHDNASYFDLSPIDLGGNARKEMTTILKEMGFEIEASHHEAAPGQHEIDFKYSDALTTADNIMTFKLIVRIIAQRHGLHATFMAKPKFGVSGSGMHINMSLATLDRVNAFADELGPNQLSPIAFQFLGGILKHAKNFTAVTNPTVNSYKRLVKGYEAPINTTWSQNNRSPLVRIPAKRGRATRLELRNPDPCANPYLALAVILKAGLDGVKNKIVPPSPITTNVYTMQAKELEELGIEKLPSNLLDAIREFQKNPLMKEALGEHAYRCFVDALTFEWQEYAQSISQWELQRYLKKF